MIRVTIEIIPFLGEPAKKLGFVDIGNVSGLAEVASYEYEARIDGRTVRGRLDHHLRQHGAVRLVARILGQVVADLERVTPEQRSGGTNG